MRTVLPSQDDHALRHLEMMLALIGRALPHGLPDSRLQLVGQSDWADSWKEHFHVVRVGRRFVIRPSWRDYAPTGDDLVIEIDPGVFDVGTGSGILSIAARQLGAGPIRAVDVDEVAVRAARENFARNGLVEKIDLVVGSAVDAGGQRWQLVVANILAHILVELMPDLAAVPTAALVT